MLSTDTSILISKILKAMSHGNNWKLESIELEEDMPILLDAL